MSQRSLFTTILASYPWKQIKALGQRVRVEVRNRRRALLTSAAVLGLTVVGGASPVQANDVLYTGGITINGTGDFSPAFILAVPGINENVAINVNTVDLVGPAGSSVSAAAFGGNIDFSLAAGRAISGGGNGVFFTSTSGNITGVVDGNLTGLNGYVANSGFLPLGGAVTLSGTGAVTGTTGAGVWIITDTAPLTVDGLSAINGGTFGLLLGSVGAINLGQTTALGAITTGGTGIDITQVFDPVNNGAININATSIAATAGFGIRAQGWGEDTTINVSGPINSGLSGIFATTTTGNILADGLGTSTVTSTAGSGVALNSGFAPDGGDVTVQNFTSIDGQFGNGVWLQADTGTSTVKDIGTVTGSAVGVLVGASGAGDVVIDNVGPITGTVLDGIYALTNGGDITVTNIGDVIGFDDGVELWTNQMGNINLTTANDITGTSEWGLWGQSVDGDVNFTLDGGTVTGGLRGLQASVLGSGDANINVNAGSIVQGQEYGLLTGTITGLATVNNDGHVRDTTDTGAASDVGGDAIWGYFGNTIVNNTGDITGRVHSNGSTSFTLNNQAGGVWTPGTGLNGFGAPGDTVNNAGTINVRTGSTVFSFLDNLNNQAGGHIDLSYGPNATDDLTVLNFAPQAGSSATFNFDAVGANNSGLGFDSVANGQGTADTIVVVGTSTPAATSTVNLVNSGGTPTALTGSVSLVYTGVNFVAPNPGDIFNDSGVYAFGTGDPTTGAVKFHLVDDGNGGLYLQWAPNLTDSSLGGFLGGDLNDNGQAGSGINSAAGRLGGGIVGGVGGMGGPSGGGVAGSVTDAAANGAMPCGSCNECSTVGFFDDAPRAGHNLWFLSNGAISNYSGSGDGSSYGFAVGADRDLGDFQVFNRTAVGVFGFVNSAQDSWLTGKSLSEAYGVGSYARVGNENGFYGSLVGSLSLSDTHLTNNVFLSTGQQNNVGYSVVLAGGHITPINDDTNLDLRLFTSYGNVNGSAFTASNGMTVNNTEAGIVTLGAMAGLQHIIDEDRSLYARAGVKWVDLDREITVGATTLNGSVNTTVGSLATGFTQSLTDSTSIDGFVFTDLAESFQSYGGNLMLTVRF